jgi:hypothetical protein
MKLPIPAPSLTVALLGLALAAHADYPATVSSLSPLGYWRLNEPTQPAVPTYPMTNYSTAGAALNGTYYGAPRLGQPGAFGTDSAANFNGTSQYAEAPYNPAFNPTGSFTVEFWANLTNDTAGAKSGVQSRYVSGSVQQGYLFFVNNGNTTWQFRVYSGTAATTVTSLSEIDVQPNVWYHVVGVYDGSRAQIYVNGQPTYSTSTTVVYAPNTNAPLRLGAGTPEGAPTLFFPGLLDEVAVYPLALSADQISSHYDAASTNASGYSAQVLALSPSAYWKLNEPAVPPYIPYAATNIGSLGAPQNGTYIGGATSGVAGPLRGQFAGFEPDNKSVGLNGTSGYISIPGFPSSLDTVTITGWIKRNGSQVNASPFLLQRATGSPATGLVVDFSNRLGYVWNDDAGSYNYNPGADFFIPDGVWTFAALAVSPTEATIYIGSTNGLKAATRTAAHAPHDFSNGELQIARDGTSGTRLIKGNLDEIALFGTTLDFTAISNLFYSATPSVPLVTRTPVNPVFEGVNVTYNAFAVSSAPMNYQWRKDGSPVGGNSPILTLNNVTPAANGSYDVVVISGGQSVTSIVDTLTVVAGPPVILTQPLSATRYAGGAVSFSVVVGGTSPFTYQWLKGGVIIPDATNATFTLTPIAATDAASYSVKVTNPNGNLTSSNAVLTVLPAPSTYASVVLQAGPQSYWTLNETSGNTAYDYAGGLDGTFPNPPVVTPGVDGPRPPGYAGFNSGNTGYQLDGTAGWVTAPPLNWNTNTVTFAAWIKLTGYDDDLSGVLFTRGDSASGIHIVSTGELRYHWDGGAWGWSSGLTVPLNEWTFVALVVEPEKATMYMGTASGLASAVNTATHNPAALADPFYLGRDRTDRPLVGLIDEAAIFKRSLGANEIGTLFGIGTGIPLVISMTPGGIIQDTKPAGTPHDGFNSGATWLASSGPDATFPAPITRTGVEQFSAAVGSQITVPPNPDFDSTTGTICFWMRANAPVPGPGEEAAIIFDRRTDNGIVITLSDGGAIFVQSAGATSSATAGYLPDNNWHFVAVTYQQVVDGQIQIFVDGTLTGLGINTAAWSWPTGQQIELGRSHDGYWKRYDGQLDDFRIYNRILTDTELGQIYSSDALVDTGALKLRYNFDDAGIGQTLTWPFGTLESSPTLDPGAIWTPMPAATSPWPILPSAPSLFYRIRL